MDAYYNRTEVSNSDLTELKNLLHPHVQYGDREQAFRFGSLVDAIITEPDRVNYFRRTVDDVLYTDEEFDHAREMNRSLRMEARHDAQMSALQLSAFQSRMEAVKVAEDAIRTERHDLRHRLQVVTELVSRGDKDAALDFLDAAQRRLDDKKAIRWCRPPVLDAVFSSYFDQAQSQGIRVEAAVSLPGELPVDEGELAVVLANALENAIHANLELPPERRELQCKMVGAPGVMLELVNPCGEAVTFDQQGLPVAQSAGHGLGVQSISSFCRKNGAVCQFEQADGWFRFRLVL